MLFGVLPALARFLVGRTYADPKYRAFDFPIPVVNHVLPDRVSRWDDGALLSRPVCLLTGVTSKVAAYLIPALESDFDLVGFSRRPVNLGWPVVVGDVASLHDCRRAVEGASAIVHLAADTTESDDALRVNAYGTYCLLQAAREADVQRVVQASTSCVYGHCRVPAGSYHIPPLPINEASPCQPNDRYGFSKLESEHVMDYFARVHGMNTSSLRLNWVWGTEEAAWWTKEVMQNPAAMVGSLWSYVDGRDAAEAFRLALSRPDLPGRGIYNICAPQTVVDTDTVELVSRFFPGSERLANSLRGNQSVFDASRARQAFGFLARHTWKDLL